MYLQQRADADALHGEWQCATLPLLRNGTADRHGKVGVTTRFSRRRRTEYVGTRTSPVHPLFLSSKRRILSPQCVSRRKNHRKCAKVCISHKYVLPLHSDDRRSALQRFRSSPSASRCAIRRDGRVVDYSSLENCRTERYRGFESLSLRKVASR